MHLEYEVVADSRPDSESAALSQAWITQSTGHPWDRRWSESSHLSVKNALAEFVPDIVILDGLWTYRALEIVVDGPWKIVLNTHNVEALIQEEIVASSLPAGRTNRLGTVLAQRTGAIEAGAVEAVDQVWKSGARTMPTFSLAATASHQTKFA